MNDRFLIDYANPDAGIGHSMGFINRAIKVSARNKLQFAYSEDQLLKSHEKSWVWKLKQAARLLRGRKRYETHNIGNDLNHMLGLKEILPRLGFTYEATLSQYYGPGIKNDALMYVLTKEHAKKWMKLNG